VVAPAGDDPDEDGQAMFHILPTLLGLTVRPIISRSWRERNRHALRELWARATWAHWRRDRTVEPALRALVRSYEYEIWPRGRIVFDRARDLFIIYADRKLMTSAMIARTATQFHLPVERTEVQRDLHYQSTETPNGLGARSTRRY
jgi:hypothetical protein